MTLPLALVCLGVLGFAGFVLWLRAQKPQPWPKEVSTLHDDVGRLATRVVNLEEWKSNVNLASGLRRKPEDRA